MKKTHISTKCNLGYDKCRLYLEWMDMMDLIRSEVDEDNFEVILLTERSRSLYLKKFKDNEKLHLLESLY